MAYVPLRWVGHGARIVSELMFDPKQLPKQEKGHRNEPMTLKFLVAGAGFEPTTSGL